MSNRTADVETVDVEDVEAALRRWYHVPLVGLAMTFMLWVRVQSIERFAMEDGNPAFNSVDSWYHWRTVEWTAANYPWTMPFDVFTGFPTGQYVGQFGTLFDQIIVTIAMIVGLGNPSTETLYFVALVAVPLMAALVAIPVYVMGRRLGGRLGGLVSVAILALAPMTFLFRTTSGQLQHHVAEVLFMAIAVLAMMVALRVGEREKPIWELLEARDVDALTTPAKYSALAGVALSLYIWSWPPGVVLVGIFGVFFVVQLCLDYVRGISPDHVAFVGAVSLGTTSLLTLLLTEVYTLGVTDMGLLQPVFAFLVAVGCVFMAWLARQWDGHELDRKLYPVGVGGLIIASLIAMALVLPDLYSTLVGNLTGRLLPFDPSTTGLTVSEVQPPDDFTAHVFDEFGMAFYTMLAGLLLLVSRPFLGREYRTEYTLVIVWALFLTSMAMTQSRFAYYLVLPVAVINAVFISDVLDLLRIDRGMAALRSIETYQIIAIVMVVMLLFMPLLPPIASTTAWDRGASHAINPSDDAMIWEESNHWLGENTPPPGDWAGAGHDDELDYFGSYDHPEGSDYEYPEGTYGVMSWWDYGHLITTQAERIPHSNPFQQHARSSSAFLTAQSEERGELILDAIAEGHEVRNEDIEELEEIIGDGDSHEEIRYVMIDHKMAGGKFSPITAWTGPDFDSYTGTQQFTMGEDESVPLEVANEDYYDTMLASLYLQDATAMEHYRLVHEADTYAVVGGELRYTQDGVAQLPRSSAVLAEGWDQDTQNLSQQLNMARVFGQIVPISETREFYDTSLQSSVKTFERVEGATITGSIDNETIATDENATVTVALDLETDPGRMFTYQQQVDLEDGAFEITVPYATNDELGVEDGYTNSSVLADGDYDIEIHTSEGLHGYNGTVEVPETAVVEGLTVDDFDLEEVPEEQLEDDPAENDTETPNDDPGDDEQTGDDEQSDDEQTDNESTDNETESITSPPAPLAVDVAG